MNLRAIITLLTLCCLTAHAANDDITLAKDHPERYVVVKGDTLWDISAKFLKDPWQWPKIWNMNKTEIKNPHWIYPGDVIVLDMSNGKPVLRLLKETVTLSPDVRIEPLEATAIPSIAPNIIAPFINKPLIIESNELDTAPTIIAGPNNHVALSHGDKIYLDQLENEGLDWHIYRVGGPIFDTDRKTILGVEAKYLGEAKVLKYGAPATAEITSAKEEIFANDKLVLNNNEIQSSFTPHPPETSISGNILSIYGGLAETGRGSVVIINRGKNDNIEDGHVLSINRIGRYVSRNPKDKKIEDKFTLKELQFSDTKIADKKAIDKKVNAEKYDPKLIKLPNERVGLLMVFRTFERLSYALVMQASEPISNADIVETPE